MTVFYLLRHGETCWDLANERCLVGGERDLVPLTPRGCEQIHTAARMLASEQIELVVSSPMCRALQSAALVSRLLDLPLEVQFDLREWLMDLSLTYRSSEEAEAAYREMLALGGEWPAGERRGWEPLSRVRARVTRVLDQYLDRERVVVVCHEVVIYALTGRLLGLADHCLHTRTRS